MKIKQWMCALFAMLALVGSAQADVIRNLHLTFQSGATYEGELTFNDDYTRLLTANGMLSGGSYGNTPINWAWWLGTGQNVGDWDGIAATHEDWLMNGTPGSWSIYIGISWFVPVMDGNLMLSLVPNASVYHAGINQSDAIVSYSFNAVSEPAALGLLAIGVLGAGAATRRRRASA